MNGILNQRNKKWAGAFLAPATTLFIVVYLIPFSIVIATAFTHWKNFSALSFVGLGNFKELAEDPRFRKAFVNTMIWVLLQSTIHVALGTALALILAHKPLGWRLVRTSYLFPNIISSAALGLMFLNIFNPQMGIINEILSKFSSETVRINWYSDPKTAFFTVTSSWLLYAGYVMLLVYGARISMPETLYEAAMIDGASKRQFDFYIALPCIKGAIGAGTILSATSMLKEFDLIYMTTQGGPGSITLNLPYYVYKTSMLELNFGYANAIGVVLILLGTLFIILINRLFRMDTAEE